MVAAEGRRQAVAAWIMRKQAKVEAAS